MPSTTRLGVIALVLAGCVAQGCTRAAPALPPVGAAEDAAPAPLPQGVSREAHCVALDLRLTQIERESGDLEARIRGKRGQNQAAGYFGALFLVPLVATDDQAEEKARLDELQAEWDGITARKRQHACPS